jgi:hypothetical protein
MDDTKKEYVIDLIKKSLSLGIEESDIINTLIDANLEKVDAEKLILEAKKSLKNLESNNSNKEKIPSSSKKIFDDNVSKLSIGDQITKQLGLEIKEKKYDDRNNSDKTQNVDGEKDKSNIKQESSMNKNDSKESDSKQGLFSMFRKNKSGKIEFNDEQEEKQLENSEKENQNKNLGEQDKTQKAIDSKTKIDKNESNALVSEEKSKNIGNKSVNDLWEKGIVVAINTKLDEIKKIRDNIDFIINTKVDSAVKKETNKFKILLESQKDLIISSNKDALEQKQKEITFIIDSKLSEIKKESKELNVMIDQIKESKKSQGDLIGQIKNVLDDAKKTKSQLLVEMNSELIKSKSQAQEFVDNAKSQMYELDSRINKTLEFEKNIAQGMLQEAEQKIEKLTLQKADDLLDELELKLNNLKSVEKNINLEGLGQKIRVLDQFKREFLNNMEENISKMNLAIKNLNEQNIKVSKEIEEKNIVIDAKLDELTKFEKTLADNLEKIISNKKD